MTEVRKARQQDTLFVVASVQLKALRAGVARHEQDILPIRCGVHHLVNGTVARQEGFFKMNRRSLLAQAAAMSLVPGVESSRAAAAQGAGPASYVALRRLRPTDPAWPDAASWDALNAAVAGRLIKVPSPLAACARDVDGADCQDLLKHLRNPYYVGDQVGATQTSGWVDAWMSASSVYAVAATTTADVVAAVNFARDHKLRLVIKGGGHSYQGTSNAADSLLVWTRGMHDIVLHDAFVPQGCSVPTVQAVSVGAGAIWMRVYSGVTTKAGRYVQGGGCTTVGVAGLIQSGGFGSFSKNYGTAASWLLEAEVVTADGTVRIANARTNPELFWGLKGGGGGSLGVVTRLTLQTHALPAFAGGAFATIEAASDDAFRRLIKAFVDFYAENLCNQHWGESVDIRRNNILSISMVSQGLDTAQSKAVWRPFFDWLAASPESYRLTGEPVIGAIPAQHWWDAEYRRRATPRSIISDPRPGASPDDFWWAGDAGQAGWFVHGYESAWMPMALLEQDQRERLVDALFSASRQWWSVLLHFNKGLGGAPAGAVAAARDTATNPAVLTAFALAIIGGWGPPAYPGLPGHEPDLGAADSDARAVAQAMVELRRVVPDAGAYVSESSYFEKDWQGAYWGENYKRLRAVKAKYDPDGLFFVHHGVGSEDWSADGFARAAER
jgi:FAD/FMN-containing dehydrogenase